MADPNTPLPPPQAGIAAGVTPSAQIGLPAALPTAPKPAPAPAGLAGMPGAQGAQGAPMGFGTPTDPLAVAGRKASMDAMGRDSAQAGLTEEQRVEQRLAFPEEQERRRKVIEEQRQADAQEFDPERQRREALKRFLIGAGGRAYGEFGAGAQASMGYDDEQAKAKAMRRKALEDMEQGIFSLKKGAVEGGIGAGADVRKQTEEARRAGLGAAANLYGTDVQAKTAQENRLSEERRAELSRQVQMAQVQAQRDRNEVDKEFLNQQKLENLKLNHLKSIQDVRKLVGNQYATEREGVAMRLSNAKDPNEVKKLQQRLQEIDTLVEAQVSRDAKDFIAVVRKIDGKLSGTGGSSPEIKIEEITE